MDLFNEFLLTSMVTVIRYFVFAGVPFLIFYKFFRSNYSASKIQSRIVSNQHLFYEIGQSMKTAIAFSLIGCLILFTPLRSYTMVYDHMADYSWWVIPVVLVVSLVIHDTYFYWLHRFMHHPAVFGKVHVVHHKSNNPSPWASYSFDLVEGVGEVMILPILLCILPMHPVTIFLFTLLSFIINVYGHLGYEIAPRWFRNSWLFEIIGTSVYHNLHHARFHYNYGLYFRCWDRLMGTEHPDYEAKYDEIQVRRFGASGSSSVTRTSIMILLICTSISLSAQTIEGTWKDPHSGALIYVEAIKGDKYQVYVLSSGNETEDIFIEDTTVFLCKELMPSQRQEDLYEGEIYLPRRQWYVNGSIQQLDENHLQVCGTKGPFRHKMLWVRQEEITP